MSIEAGSAVINTADADNPFVVEVLLQALEDSGKKLRFFGTCYAKLLVRQGTGNRERGTVKKGKR